MKSIMHAWMTRRSVLVALCAFVVGCGSDDPTGVGGGGSYTATLSGDLSGSISGAAFFGTGTDPDTNEQAWIAYLVDGATGTFSGGDNVLFFGLGAPVARSYSLQDIGSTSEFPDGEAAGMVIIYDGQTLQGALSSTGGTLTVTSVSANSMNGTFSFTAAGTVFDGTNYVQGTVMVSGSFEATGGNFLTPF